jgi:hypothetical protein
LGHCQGFAKLLVTSVLILLVYITRSYTPDAVPNIVYLHILHCLGKSVVWYVDRGQFDGLHTHLYIVHTYIHTYILTYVLYIYAHFSPGVPGGGWRRGGGGEE